MTLVGRAVSSERGETYAACDVFHVRVIYMSIDSYIYIFFYSVYMNNYTCIYQYVSSRAGGAKVQLLHVCSLTLGGLLHIHSLICSYVYNINIGIWCMSLMHSTSFASQGVSAGSWSKSLGSVISASVLTFSGSLSCSMLRTNRHIYIYIEYIYIYILTTTFV